MKGKDVVNAELKISFCGGRKGVNETPTMKFNMEDLVAHNANKENVGSELFWGRIFRTWSEISVFLAQN